MNNQFNETKNDREIHITYIYNIIRYAFRWESIRFGFIGISVAMLLFVPKADLLMIKFLIHMVICSVIICVDIPGYIYIHMVIPGLLKNKSYGELYTFRMNCERNSNKLVSNIWKVFCLIFNLFVFYISGFIMGVIQ